jgi:hypothetical protein
MTISPLDGDTLASLMRKAFVVMSVVERPVAATCCPASKVSAANCSVGE